MADERILVVDDSEFIRGFLKELLSDEEYNVDTASDGNRAIELFNSRHFDLIITDINMPNTNGIELLKYVRGKDPDVIVLIITGYASLDTARDAIQLGAMDYIFKPFKHIEIVTAVRNSVEKLRMAQENARLKETIALFNVSEAISSTIRSDSLYPIIISSAVVQTKSSKGALVLFDRENKILRLKHIDGQADLNQEFQLNHIRYPAVEFILNSKRPLLLSHSKDHPLSGEVDHWEYSRELFPEIFPVEKEIILFPLRAQGKTYGFFIISKAISEPSFSKSDIQVLSIISNQSAISIENSYLVSDLERNYVSTLHSLSIILEAKHPYTKGHTQRVTEYSMMIGREMGLSEDELQTLEKGANLHDIGKIGISDSILNKPDTLTEEEMSIVRQHTIIGDNIIRPIKFLSNTRPIIRSHHERLDGKGWPDGLKGNDIPFLVRICTIADAFDAMTSERPYRETINYKRIHTELVTNSGTQFDTDIATVFSRLMEEGKISCLETPTELHMGKI